MIDPVQVAGVMIRDRLFCGFGRRIDRMRRNPCRARLIDEFRREGRNLDLAVLQRNRRFRQQLDAHAGFDSNGVCRHDGQAKQGEQVIVRDKNNLLVQRGEPERIDEHNPAGKDCLSNRQVLGQLGYL